MRVGIDDIANDPRYGMPSLHMQGLMQAAQKIGPIGVRPVSAYARTYLEAGCPTKPFAVKNKSANLGIAAGLIPIDPTFGRVLTAEYGKHTKQLEDAFHKVPDLKKIPLVVTEARLTELMKMFNGKMLAQQTNTNDLTFGWEKEGQMITVTASKNTSGTYDVLHNGEPLLVLGKTVIDQWGQKIDKPITADYDLLVVCPAYADFDPGNKDKSPFRTQGTLNVSGKENIQKVMASESHDYEGPKEDKKAGNWSKRIEETIYTINNEIGKVDNDRRHPGAETTHHNAEFTNPFADDLKNNVPCLMVLPRKMDISHVFKHPNAKNAEVVLIETPQEMSKMRDVLRDAGYYWPAHAKYKEDIKPFRDEAVAAASKAISMHRTKNMFENLYANKENSENQNNQPKMTKMLEEHHKRHITQVDNAIEPEGPSKMRRR